MLRGAGYVGSSFLCHVTNTPTQVPKLPTRRIFRCFLIADHASKFVQHHTPVVFSVLLVGGVVHGSQALAIRPC